jgi:hypothetical protein
MMKVLVSIPYSYAVNKLYFQHFNQLKFGEKEKQKGLS